MANFCRNCGKQAEEGGAFCAACGMSLTTLSPAYAPNQHYPVKYTQSPAPPPSQDKKKKIWIPISAIVVVLALAFCGLFFFTDIFKTGDDGSTVGGTTVGGTTTTSPGTSPSETPNTSPTPESTPPATPTPESAPPETPPTEETPSETPPPETPPPELPPNHISAQFFDLAINGDSFYMDYAEECLNFEEYYANGSDPDDLWYHVNHPHRYFFQDARQGSLCAYWWLAETGLITHYIIKDNKEYKIRLYHPDHPMHGVDDWMEVRDVPPSTTGTISLTFGSHGRGGGVEYAGSGVGAINGVTMPYDIYNEIVFGMAIGIAYRVYLDGDTVPYMAIYTEGELTRLYSFSVISLTVPQDKMWLLDVPEDLPIR